VQSHDKTKGAIILVILSQIVESITIINAVHDYMTALPPGPLSLDTTIKIDVTAKIKYEGM
jgi:hypothetical protein